MSSSAPTLLFMECLKAVVRNDSKVLCIEVGFQLQYTSIVYSIVDTLVVVEHWNLASQRM